MDSKKHNTKPPVILSQRLEPVRCEVSCGLRRTERGAEGEERVDIGEGREDKGEGLLYRQRMFVESLECGDFGSPSVLGLSQLQFFVHVAKQRRDSQIYN